MRINVSSLLLVVLVTTAGSTGALYLRSVIRDHRAADAREKMFDYYFSLIPRNDPSEVEKHQIGLSRYVGARLMICLHEGKLHHFRNGKMYCDAIANIKEARVLFGDETALCQAIAAMNECNSGQPETRTCDKLLSVIDNRATAVQYMKSMPEPVGR